MTLIEIYSRMAALSKAAKKYPLCRSEQLELQILISLKNKKLSKMDDKS